MGQPPFRQESLAQTGLRSVYGSGRVRVQFSAGLTERQALEVSDALSARRNFAAHSAARKIRDQARVNVDAGETRTAVALEPEEVAELAAVMTEVAWPDEPQYARPQAMYDGTLERTSRSASCCLGSMATRTATATA